MRVFARVVIAALSLVLIAAILFPVFATTGHLSHRSPCINRLKQASLGILIYQGDADDRYPGRDEWVDASFPYVKNWDVFRCPSVGKTLWGYSFNGALSRAKTPKLPEKNPLIYDSTNLTKNASDLVTSLPAVPRHGKNMMAYADGHARALPAAVVE